jgi:hypothetical protein
MKLQIQTGKKTGPVRAVIYGGEGLGKTTTAAQLTGPVLFFDLEDGTSQLDVARVSINSWPELLTSLAEIAKYPSGFRTLVIDSADWAERLCSEDLLKTSGKKSIEDFGYGKGYTILAERIARALELCDAVIKAGLHVVWVAHSKTVRFSPPDQTDGYDRYELKMNKMVAPLFKEWPDLLLFANYQIQIVEGTDGRVKAQGGKLRQIFTSRTAAWDAKNRFGLPDVLPMPLGSIAPELAAVFSGAPAKPAPAPAPAAPAPAAPQAPVTPPAAPAAPITDPMLAMLTAYAKNSVAAPVIERALAHFSHVALGDFTADQAARVITRCQEEMNAATPTA